MAVQATTWAKVLERRHGAPQANGALDVIFSDIGQGDFTILWLPNDAVVVVDCGTLRWGGVTEANMRENLPKAANGEPLPIDVLVLSHPDADHYNQVSKVLKGIQINEIYYSKNLAQYKMSSYRRWWWSLRRGRGGFGIAHTPTVNEDHSEPILITEGEDCSVWAIASNVESAKPNNPYGINTASIVVKCEFGNDSLIVAGDATCTTEEFLVTNENDWTVAELKSDVLRVGHHGSQTSSSQEFLDAVDAPKAVVSTSDGNVYGLPRRSVMTRLEAMVDDDAAHEVSLYADNGAECVKAVEDAEPLALGIEVKPAQKERITKDLWVTGVTGDVVFTLDGI